MSVLDGPGEGTWSVFALKAVEQRDELLHKLAGHAAHIKSLEGLLVDAVRERDEARAEVADLSNKYTASWKCSLDVPEDPCFDCIRCLRLRLKGRLCGAMLLAEERGAEWAIRAKAQVVYALAGDAAYALLARDVCREARKR